jgi:CHAT domain-containing protein
MTQDGGARDPRSTAGDAATRRARCAEFERLSLSDPRRAVTEADALLEEMRAADDPANFAYVSRSLVNALPHLGEPREAIRRAAIARRYAFGRAPDEAARMLIAAMHPRAKLGNLRGSMRAGEQAAREFEALGMQDLVARAELNLANVAKALGMPQRAAELIDRVLARGEAIVPIRGQALNVYGEACVQRADLAGARRAFEESLAILSAQGHGFACAVVAGNLADTAARAGDIEAALRGFRDARDRYAALGAHAEACRNALEQATLLEFAGLLSDARDCADEATALAEAHGLAAESARARLVAGRVLLAISEWRDAEAALDDAAARFRALGDMHGASQALAALARARRLLRDPRAAHTAREAVQAVRGTTAPVEIALSLAELAAAETNAEAAGRAAQESISVADATAISAIRAESRSAAAGAARRAGLAHEAVRLAREAFAEVERSRENLSLARTRRAFLTRRSDIAAELVAALLSDGSADAAREAFSALDRARSLAILDAIHRAGDSARSAPRDARLDQRARELLARLDLHGRDRSRIAEAARADREAERAALEQRLADGSVADIRTDIGASARRETRAATGSAAASLAIDATALATFEHEGRIEALVRMPDGTVVARAIAAERRELDACIAEYRFHIARRLQASPSGMAAERMRRSAAAAEARLSHLVIEPIRDLLAGSRRVVLLPSATIARLPMLALSSDSLELSVAPSLEVASLFDARRHEGEAQERTRRGSFVASVGDDATPGIAREGVAVARALASRGTVEHLDGGAATLAACAEAFARARLGHIACHGVFPPAAPNLAGLRLADGWFTARDAHALASAPEDLVLSGCVTGTSALHDGEEWFGLVRGFAAAGTRRVVASLWPVDDEATASLMPRLHAGDATPARALLDAMRELRAQGAHPALSSAFVVIGGATAFAG